MKVTFRMQYDSQTVLKQANKLPYHEKFGSVSSKKTDQGRN